MLSSPFNQLNFSMNLMSWKLIQWKQNLSSLLLQKLQYGSRHKITCFLHISEIKGTDHLSNFVITMSLVQSLNFLTLKSQASNHLLWQYSSDGLCRTWSESPKTFLLWSSSYDRPCIYFHTLMQYVNNWLKNEKFSVSTKICILVYESISLLIALVLLSASLVTKTTVWPVPWSFRCVWYHTAASRIALSLRSLAVSPFSRSMYVSLQNQIYPSLYEFKYYKCICA